MQLTTDELLTIHTKLSDKEMQIVRLQNEVKRLTEENERLRQNALQQQVTMQGGTQFIILKLDKVCRVLRNLKDTRMVSFIYTALQKMLPSDTTPEAIRQITDSVSLEVLPLVNLTADGDINVAGNLNNIHDNEQVNF